MKSVGAQIVARDAVDLLISFLEDSAKDVTSSASQADPPQQAHQAHAGRHRLVLKLKK